MEIKLLNRSVPKISWRAYFRRFCAEHGGDPFEFKGWLLFRDGWRYSNATYRGPELAPCGCLEQPCDCSKRKELSRVYWKLRRASVVRERRLLEMNLRTLEALQRDRSAPLQASLTHRDRVTNPVTGLQEWYVEVEHRDADFQSVRDRLDDLRHWEAECVRELEAFNE